MNISYIAKFNESFEINAKLYETPGKYINNIKETNYKLNVTWGKIKKISANLKLKANNIAKKYIYQK
jgi:hypothetical protein